MIRGRVLRHLIKPILALIILLSTFVTILLVILTLPLRITARVLAAIFKPDLAGIITGLSAIPALDRLDDRPKSNLVVCIIADGDLTVDKLRFLLQNRVINKKTEDGRRFYPELRQTPTHFLGYMFWKRDPSFKLTNHCRLYDYNKDLPLGSPCTEEDLRKVLGGLITKGWRTGLSPWEFLVVPNFQPGKPTASGSSTLVIFRIHHVLADGASVNNLVIRDLAQTNYRVPGLIRKKISIGTKIFQNLSVLTAPWVLACHLAEAYDTANAWHLNSKLLKEYHVSFTEPIGVKEIKALKNRLGVRYNTVLYAALSGGIARIMKEAGQPVPEEVSAFSPFPLPDHPATLSNHMSMAYVRLPIRCDSREEQLRRIEKSFSALAKSSIPYSMYTVFRMYTLLPTWIARLSYCLNSSTLLVSIFPAPEEDFALGECRVVDAVASVPLGPGQQGAAILVAGYGGTLRFVCNVDKKIFPTDVIFQKLGRYIQDELELLSELKT